MCLQVSVLTGASNVALDLEFGVSFVVVYLCLRLVKLGGCLLSVVVDCPCFLLLSLVFSR